MMGSSRQLVAAGSVEGGFGGSSSSSSSGGGSDSEGSFGSGSSSSGEELALEERVDPALLAAVKPYEALPTDAADYGRAGFWDSRYAELDDLVFEWYHPWENIAPSLVQYMDEGDDVLVCGCGNSALSAAMHGAGFARVTSVDMSRVVIDQMRVRHPPAEYPGMQWLVMDLTLTDFPPASFDVAVDKACLDAIMCRHDCKARVSKYLLEMDRILRDDGVFICVSSGRPEERLELLERWELDIFRADQLLPWDVHVDAIAKPTVKAYDTPDLSDPEEVYYIYVCMKDPEKWAVKDKLCKKSEADQMKKLAKLTGKKRRVRRPNFLSR
eukprot:TRINITY_DN861_c1_g2_i2.p2 TRINITY_DN861_c1_g2~~TRINITY_DN861_c1_g2_i2.p2  ORF type:complete len:326 (-),score=139.27 TRINITY_DN861_c1_g2_i2:772-1749(-)